MSVMDWPALALDAAVKDTTAHLSTSLRGAHEQETRNLLERSLYNQVLVMQALSLILRRQR